MSRRYLIIIIVLCLVFVGGMAFLVLKGDLTNPGSATTTKKTGLSSLFPFLAPGTSKTSTAPSGGTAGSSSQPAPNAVATGPIYFKQISSKVVAGLITLPYDPNAANTTHSAIGNGQVDTAPMVRYAEQGTGYIYDIRADGTGETKVSNTVVSRTAIAQFGMSGASVVMRFVRTDNQTVGAFLGTVVPPADPNAGIAGTLSGSFLPDNIIDIAVSPDGKSLAYEAPISGGSVGMTEKMDGTGKKQVFENAFSEWLLGWTTAGITATSKAASDISGYSYVVNPAGTFIKTLGPTPGLTTLPSPDGKKILYGIGSSGTVQLHIRTLQSGTDINLGLGTLPEKCLWTADSTTVYCGVPQYVPSGTYPDSWYQGTVSFNDAIWKIDAGTGTTTKITTGAEGLIDATDLAITPDNSYLFVVNKIDGSLWSLDLAKASQ